MKRIGICGTILGLLACAAVANAEQGVGVNANGSPLAGANVFAMIAGATGANKIVLPPTGSNGSINLSQFELPNYVNQPIAINVDECNQQPTVLVVPQDVPAPLPEKDCKRYELGAALWGGIGSGWKLRPGAPGKYALTLNPAPAAAVAEPSRSPFNLEGFIGGNVSSLPGLKSLCSFGTTTSGATMCSVSNHSGSIDGHIGLGFSIVNVLMGGFHDSEVSVNATQTFTTSTGSTGTLHVMQAAHFNAWKFGAQVNLLGISHATLAPEGGILGGTIKGTRSFFTSTGGPTSGGGVPQPFSIGVEEPWFGIHAGWSLSKHFAIGVDWARTDLEKPSANLRETGQLVCFRVEYFYE
jgi:hypothetical protein